MKKNLIKSGVVALALLLGTVLSVSAAAQTLMPQVSVLKGEKNFWNGYDPVNVDGTVNVVIEIAAGTTAKYMVDLKSGMIELEQKNGAPRYVQYLGYPCNYGMVPRTLLGKELGGDGDPLDILVLGPSLPRGTVVPVRVLGLIQLVDAGDKDDKLIAVPADSPLAKAKDLAELDALFPGITSILETWFENYKGKDALQCSGFGGKADADALLAAGIDSFDASEKGEKKEPAKAAVSDRR